MINKEKLEAKRHLMGYSRKQLADYTGLHEQTITRIEKGIITNPNIETLLSLTKALLLDLDEIIVEKN